MTRNIIAGVWAWLFDMAFWQQLATTFIGAGLAIPAGIWLDRCVKNKQERQERAQLILALSEAFEENRKLLGDLDTGLGNTDYLPLFPLDLYLLDATALRKYELLGSINVCKKIDQARSKLKIINVQLDLMRDMLADASISALVRAEVDRVRLTCKSQVIIAKDAIALALEEIKRVDGK